jgi:hypothetical protein
LNQSITRIRAELPPTSASLICYDAGENQAECRAWSLEKPLGEERPEPIAQYDGIDVLAVHLVTKRHIAEDIDDTIKERKCSRTNDVSPYEALGLACHSKGDRPNAITAFETWDQTKSKLS